MGRQNTYNWSVISLALWILFVSTGFSLSHHYCQGDLKSSRIMVTAPNCHSIQQNAHCSHSKINKNDNKDQEIDSCVELGETKDCCSDTIEFVKLDTELVEVSISNFDFSPYFTFVYLQYLIASIEYSTTPLSNTHYQNHSPPLLYKNIEIPIFVQSFLC